jgi:glucose-6-phosphate 1-dehydrogenase
LRIEQYVEKETVQNILAFRFGNSMFEPPWNRNFIDLVPITVVEEASAGDRGGFYEDAGAIRDMKKLPNAILTMVVTVTPTLLQAVEVRNHKADVLEVIGRITADEVEY